MNPRSVAASLALVAVVTACTSSPGEPAGRDVRKEEPVRVEPSLRLSPDRGSVLRLGLATAEGCVPGGERDRFEVVLLREGGVVGIAEVPELSEMRDGVGRQEHLVPRDFVTPTGGAVMARAGDVIRVSIGQSCSADYEVTRVPRLFIEPMSGPVGTVVTLRGFDCYGSWTADEAHLVAYAGGTGDGMLELERVPATRFVRRIRIPARFGPIQGTGGGPTLPGTTILFHAKPSSCESEVFTVTGRSVG